MQLGFSGPVDSYTYCMTKYSEFGVPMLQEDKTRRSGLMTLGEVAEYLRVPKATIYAWRSRGEGPSGLKVGRHVRFRPSDVEEWLATRADISTIDIHELVGTAVLRGGAS